MTNKWQNIVGYDHLSINEIRKELHKGVQLIGAFPRTFLPHDPTDESASLVWHSGRTSLESNPVKEVLIGLSFNDFSITVIKNENLISKLALEGQSVNQALTWIRGEITKLGFKGNELNLNLPYDIEEYNFDNSLLSDSKIQSEFTSLYNNSQLNLEEVKSANSDAFDIRCWPHHFDIATLLPLKKDEKGSLTQTIGVGFSPGDESIDQPYYYVNIWPNIDQAKLIDHKLTNGQWNTKGWSGAVLLYKDILKAKQQQNTVRDFLNNTISILKEVN